MQLIKKGKLASEVFTISIEGNSFIELQIKKWVSFFIVGNLMLFIISFISVLRRGGLDNEKILLALSIFTIMFLFHLRGFLKHFKTHGRLIKEIYIEDNIVTVNVYSGITNSENSYFFDKDQCYLEKGIGPETDKSIDILTYQILIP